MLIVVNCDEKQIKVLVKILVKNHNRIYHILLSFDYKTSIMYINYSQGSVTVKLPCIHKEVEQVEEPIYRAKLENGVIIDVYDGYAIGSDNKTYYFVGREVDGDLEHIGWSSEIDGALML